MRTNNAVRWLAFAALILSLVSMCMGSDALLVAAATAMAVCVALTFSQREIKEER